MRMVQVGMVVITIAHLGVWFSATEWSSL